MGIGFRKLALVGAALVAGSFAVAGDAFAQIGGPTTAQIGGPTTAPIGRPGVRPNPGMRPNPGFPGVRPNPGFPGGRPPGHWQRPPSHGGGWGPPRPHYRPPMYRPRPQCTVQYRIVPSPYGPVRRPFRVCY